jgi:hypothetical protein
MMLEYTTISLKRAVASEPRALTSASPRYQTVTGAKSLDNWLLVFPRKTQISSVPIGADGGRSKTRSLLGIPFPGHTWPEKLVATDVWLSNEEGGPITTTLLMDPVHYTILSPLSPPIPGQVSKWRFTFALNPEDLKSKTDEDFLLESHIAEHYDRGWVGSRPVSYKIDRKATYTVHQRLAANFKKGRCLLAGDAAHVNNVSFKAMDAYHQDISNVYVLKLGYWWPGSEQLSAGLCGPQ